MKNISVDDLKNYEAEGQSYFLVDIREKEELETARMDGMPFHHFPMSEIDAYLDQLPKDQEIVLFCRSGARSARTAEYLESKGFDNCSNLIGGIMAWGQNNA